MHRYNKEVSSSKRGKIKIEKSVSEDWNKQINQKFEKIHEE